MRPDLWLNYLDNPFLDKSPALYQWPSPLGVHDTLSPDSRFLGLLTGSEILTLCKMLLGQDSTGQQICGMVAGYPEYVCANRMNCAAYNMIGISPPSHGGNRGSNPLGSAKLQGLVGTSIRVAQSLPSSGLGAVVPYSALSGLPLVLAGRIPSASSCS